MLISYKNITKLFFPGKTELAEIGLLEIASSTLELILAISESLSHFGLLSSYDLSPSYVPQMEKLKTYVLDKKPAGCKRDIPYQ